jgi:hypothetical protein
VHLEVIGVITIILGYLGLLVGPWFAIGLFFASTLLGAAAAIILDNFGGANIQPAHLLLGFIAVSIFTRRDALRLTVRSLSFPNEGFWLLLTGIYAVLSALFLPRLLAGSTYVFAIARTELGPGIVSMPLAPTSGNITQPIYFLGDVVCFLAIYSAACRRAGLETIVRAAIACAAINLLFALIDLATYWTNTGDLLSVIRNASYRMLDDAEVLGFKRIVGSFPEASTFAYFTLGFFAFCTRLWLTGLYTRLTGPLAMLSLCALLLSTSSTGYAGTGGFVIALLVTSLAQVMTRPVSKRVLVLVTVAPPLVVSVLLGLRLDQPIWEVVQHMTDRTITYKLTTESGVERTMWNEQALTNFADTGGLGGGVGSVRASSFPVAVLGNIGVIGALTYGSFLFALLARRKSRWTAPYPAACQAAARWACFAQLVGASVAGSFIDLGLPFFIFAGLACAGPVLGHVSRTVPAVGQVTATAG